MEIISGSALIILIFSLVWRQFYFLRISCKHTYISRFSYEEIIETFNFGTIYIGFISTWTLKWLPAMTEWCTKMIVIYLCSTKEGFLKQFERCFYDREERELIFWRSKSPFYPTCISMSLRIFKVLNKGKQAKASNWTLHTTSWLKKKLALACKPKT